MAQFYGRLQGNRGAASRLGSKASGLETVAAGWQGAIRVYLWNDEGEDRYRVSLIPWQGSEGTARLLSEGVLDSSKEET